MNRLKTMLDRAITLAEEGLNQEVSCIDVHELGEIVDIVKDLEEAMYYCSITKAMEESNESEKYIKKYILDTSNCGNKLDDKTDVK